MTRIPIFLAPAFAKTSSRVAARPVARYFSSTACNEARHKTPRKEGRDSNRERGVSAMRSTGTRHQLGVHRTYPELPRPARFSDKEKQPAYKSKLHDIDEQHGLYKFFNEEKQALTKVAEGRAWLPHDLIFKDFQELHAIWWNCHFEKNRLSVHLAELKRLRIADEDVEQRMKKVKKSMGSIRDVLVQREEAYQEALVLKEREGMAAIDQRITDAQYA